MEFLLLVRQGIEAVKAKDWLCALKCLNKAFGLALDSVHPDHPPAPLLFSASCPYSDADTCCAHLASLLPNGVPEGAIVCWGTPSAAIPWQSLLPVVLDLIRFLLERK